MSTITPRTCVATGSGRGGDRLRGAAEHLYEAECALHTARQSGVDSWISAAYDHLHSVVVEYEAALAAARDDSDHRDRRLVSGCVEAHRPR